MSISRLQNKVSHLEKRYTAEQTAPFRVILWDDEPMPPVPPGRDMTIVRLPRQMSLDAWTEHCREQYPQMFDEHR